MFQSEIFILQLHYNGNRDNANGATQKVGTCIAYMLYNELVGKNERMWDENHEIDFMDERGLAP
jgi:hypothetical protein